MELRAPAYPLITVDPYFSVWSMSDRLNESVTKHWTGKPNPITAAAVIDGTPYLWMGENPAIKKMEQLCVEVDALSTTYRFFAAGVQLEAAFTTPLLPEDFYLLSRPVSYLHLRAASTDGRPHDVRITLSVTEEICLNERGQMPVVTETAAVPGAVSCARIGSTGQHCLDQKGDDLRIDWGYFYLASPDAEVFDHIDGVRNGLSLSAPLTAGGESGKDTALVLFAYDDIYCLEYYHRPIKAYWKSRGLSIEQAIAQAAGDYRLLKARCDEFSARLFHDAEAAGGRHYAELLSLAWRQVLAAHKLALDENGEAIYISKECYSNGCAATVDVSYPSIPLFLIYNPALIRGMLIPVFRYAESAEWPFNFAPHDAGRYPIVNGQDYTGPLTMENQMPVEECGNMLIMTAAVCLAERDVSFALRYMKSLQQWADYLEQFGMDPENQLCTDDFAGHLAHNCNLSVKAIMALGAFGLIKGMAGDGAARDKYLALARKLAAGWVENAANGDGSFRLAFDKPGSFSMKYNIVWDTLFGTSLFPKEAVVSEYNSYRAKFNEYGLPLDSRADYTKSDWMLWTGAISGSKEDFARYANILWDAYNASESRVPLTDWFDTKTAKQIGFQNRTVQGGLFIRLLDELGICKFTGI